MITDFCAFSIPRATVYDLTSYHRATGVPILPQASALWVWRQLQVGLAFWLLAPHNLLAAYFADRRQCNKVCKLPQCKIMSAHLLSLEVSTIGRNTFLRAAGTIIPSHQQELWRPTQCSGPRALHLAPRGVTAGCLRVICMLHRMCIVGGARYHCRWDRCHHPTVHI
jgi:hypothetical protein